MYAKALIALALVGTLAMGAPSVQAADVTDTLVDFRPNPNVKDWLRGRVLYLETKTGEWRGEEEWTLTHNADDSRTLRIFTLISATEVMRDFTHHVDKDFRPIESYQSLWRKGKRTGSGFYAFTDDGVDATVVSPHGAFTQRVETKGPFTMIVHSMAADGWHFWGYDREKGGIQTITAINPSAWGDGVQSVLARIHPTKIQFKGKERIKVPAGEFDCEVWLIEQREDGAWLNEVWVYGPHKVMVKLIDQPNGKTYLLDRFEQPKR